MKKIFTSVMASAAMMAIVSCQSGTTATQEEKENTSAYLVIGTGVDETKTGIMVLDMDTEDLSYTAVDSLTGIASPTFMCITKDKSHIYAVGEKSDPMEATANSLSFDIESGKLSLLNSQVTKGGSPCYISLTPDEKTVVTANYFGGNISRFNVLEDATLDTVTVIGFTGKGADLHRQSKPYLHCISYTPDGKYLLGNDLGTDSIHVLSLEDWSRQESVYLTPASGPRHICWAPDGKHAYLVSELSDEVFTLKYENEKLEMIQHVAADSVHASGSADIHITRDGAFVYASHRLNAEGISIFKVDKETGLVNKIGYQPCGAHPRNFTLSPDERFLFVACRDDNHIEIYERDANTGLIKDTGKRIGIEAPMFVMFVTKD